tara:strand:+ start:4898 stop:5467 length:570 start_codon:yes stop_codon:yes gene_type:complete
MAITTALSKYFKQELLKGTHDFDNDTFRVKLIKVGATRDYNAELGMVAFLTGGTQFAGQAGSEVTGNASEEVTGTGYDSVYNSFSGAPEAVLATQVPDGSGGFNSVTYPLISGTKAIVDFNDTVFQSVTVAAIGCILYNDTMGGSAGNGSSLNNVVATFDFGGTVSATAGDFTVQFPTPDATSAILRIA